MGSTCASTGLLQYDIDRSLHELIDLLGEKKAVRAYKLSLHALCNLISLAAKLKVRTNCEPRSGLRFAKFKKDVAFLEKEFTAHAHHGFDVEFWDEAKVNQHFSFSAPAALCTLESAIADPFRLTHSFLQDAIANGGRVFDKTGLKNVERLRRSVVVHASNGQKIDASKVIILPLDTAGTALHSASSPPIFLPICFWEKRTRMRKYFLSNGRRIERNTD